MNPSGRSPLSSIENVGKLATAEEIELSEVSEPLLPTSNDIPRPIDEDDETTPFPLNSDDYNDGQPHVHFRPETDDDSVPVRQLRRRSSDERRRSSDERQYGRLQQMARDFWADLMPTGNRNQRLLPLIIFSIVILLMILLIIFVILGYTSVDYDEFGVAHNLITGVLDLKHPYSNGIHIILPWKRMVKFDKTARYLNFDDLAIFTTDQASIVLDTSIVYRIRPNQIEPIWLNFATEHEQVLRLVTENILLNYGNQFSIYDYRARREHVEYRLSHILLQTLSGDCCPICCQQKTCSKTIAYSCSKLSHCSNTSSSCSNGYFVDVDAVYIFKVALPAPIIKRLHTLMLKPLFTETAESQETAAVVRIETERQRNELLNKARQVLMSALANNELIREKARIKFDSLMLKQLSDSEENVFQKLNIQNIANKLSASFLVEMNHLANLSKTIDINSFVAQFDQSDTTKQTNDLFDFVPAANVFDMTEFLSILEH
ncbi:unnamed protein product [Rotaria magnacalcarata]|uniref:Band 7 domain-containing protein n=5 Tax=Rotaria magnacalcarata TaxID=392030 RepID=A0A816AXH0_9BILA|nr:unnamed protein product [Rotaria magnacalcarata]CAF1626418.1 unnamed protein product [Rotaria magnacalcarata]CAF1910859.1 unnamed protein product [Rotaria magnacalcarata]